MSYEKVSIGFIGGGKMAEAMLKGFLAAEITTEKQVVICGRSQARLDLITTIFPSVSVTTDIQKVCTCSVVVLAVKPQSLTPDVIEAFSCHSEPLFISIIA